MTPADHSSAGFTRWIADLEDRHLRDMTTSEVARALRALSSTYVERRARLSDRGAFDTAGKRAAYALYYAPRRFLTVTHLLEQLAVPRAPTHVVNLGCGTGAAGAAWAVHAGPGASVLGVDVHPWALEETRATLRAFGLTGQARRAAVLVAASSWKEGRGRGDEARTSGLMLSYVVNELERRRAHGAAHDPDGGGAPRRQGVRDRAALAPDLAVVERLGRHLRGRRRPGRRVADPTRAPDDHAGAGAGHGPRRSRSHRPHLVDLTRARRYSNEPRTWKTEAMALANVLAITE